VAVKIRAFLISTLDELEWISFRFRSRHYPHTSDMGPVGWCAPESIVPSKFHLISMFPEPIIEHPLTYVLLRFCLPALRLFKLSLNLSIHIF
jgi:hypothetical protein